MSYLAQRGMGQVDCSGGSSSACGWFDNIWASDACLSWYAQCDPTNPFYLVNSKGLIVGGAQVIGATAADAASATVGLPPGIPLWVWLLGGGALAFMISGKFK